MEKENRDRTTARQKRKIIKGLIVDDQFTQRRIFRKMLSPYCEEIMEAVDGLEALKCVQDEEFDICLMDIMMPIMNGREFLERARPFLVDCCVIVVSSCRKSQIDECLAMGATACLKKPFTSMEFHSCLINALEDLSLEMNDPSDLLNLAAVLKKLMRWSENQGIKFDTALAIAKGKTT